MRHVDQLELAPGEEKTLRPGGLHLMLFRPQRPLRDGDRTELVLHCGEQRQVVNAPILRSAP